MYILSVIFFSNLGSSSSSSNNVGGGYGYGYSGSFSGNGGNAGNIPYPPIPNFDFEGLLNGYFNSFRKYHEQFINNRGGENGYSYALAFSRPNANVQAQSSITFVNKNRIQQQAQLASQGGYAPGYGSYGGPDLNQRGFFSGGGGGGFSGTDGGAVASASIGPQGGYHTAAVYPENPNSPNIFSRFAETSQGGGGGSGSGYGVFTSSVSSSSNVNGKPQSFHRASTTINDNGKVTTYTVKNP